MNTAMMTNDAMNAIEDEHIGSFNGPEDDAEDFIEDDFNLEELDAISGFDDFDDEDEF